MKVKSSLLFIYILFFLIFVGGISLLGVFSGYYLFKNTNQPTQSENTYKIIGGVVGGVVSTLIFSVFWVLSNRLNQNISPNTIQKPPTNMTSTNTSTKTLSKPPKITSRIVSDPNELKELQDLFNLNLS